MVSNFVHVLVNFVDAVMPWLQMKQTIDYELIASKIDGLCLHCAIASNIFLWVFFHMIEVSINSVDSLLDLIALQWKFIFLEYMFWIELIFMANAWKRAMHNHSLKSSSMSTHSKAIFKTKPTTIGNESASVFFFLSKINRNEIVPLLQSKSLRDVENTTTTIR